MERDGRPICVGYLRSCPTSQDEEEQRKSLSWWFWNHAYRDYDWGGFYQDKPKAPNEMMKRRRSRERHPCSYMWVRPACEQMREELQKGDLVIACRLGLLCNDITDALEGLPTFLDRPIRVVLTEDNVELRSEDLKLLRALQHGATSSVLVVDGGGALARCTTASGPVPAGCSGVNSAC